MTQEQAQIALTVVKAIWASLPPEFKKKIEDWALSEIRQISQEQIREFFASLPKAQQEPSTMDSIDAGRMLGNVGQEQ